MPDFQSFKHGAVTLPLPLAGSGLGGAGATLLRDGDPAIFYMLEFFESVMRTHLGDRFIQEVAAVSFDTDIPSIVEMTVPMNPQPFLDSTHFKFPLLAIWRESGSFKYMGHRKVAMERVNCAYVLPPMSPDRVEALLPILKLVVATLDNRSEQGFDPAYTPTTPTGTAGEKAWYALRAGLKSIELKTYEYGSFPSINQLSFPGVVMNFDVQERSEADLAELAAFNGADPSVDFATTAPGEDPATLQDVAATATYEPPVLTGVSPLTGTKSGGTPLTITGTGFISGRRYRVLFGAADASSVTVVGGTTLTCITPQYIANPTAAVNVRVIDQDGQLANTLTTAFTFTSP